MDPIRLNNPNEVDEWFLERAEHALDKAGVTVQELLAKHPKSSVVELAKALGRGANAAGLTTKIYKEAIRTNTVRKTAQNLLYRQLLAAFPSGWFTEPDFHASVKLGSWDYTISKLMNEKSAASMKILRELAIDNPPPDGWTPDSESDQRICALFDQYWPDDKL